MPITDSPLRYPGGKTQMNKFILDLFEYNNINKNTTYVEPFAGGAGLALYLLFNNYVSKICINDFDEKIYCMWYSILYKTEEFVDLIINTPITVDSWHYFRSIYNDPSKHSVLRVGFATFYLNRTNRSGIITGGPIGGFDQNAKDKINCRFNKKDLIRKINRISYWKDSINIFNEDAEDFISNNILNMDPHDTFIFFDPPYYKQGKNLYANFYNHSDHLSLSESIAGLINYKWITTYDNQRHIMQMYNGVPLTRYFIRYSANKVRKEEELLIHSPKIKLPISENIIYSGEYVKSVYIKR